MSARPAPMTRADFRRFVPIQTRWGDNDVYGHVNNVVYYAYFDTAVNSLLIEAGTLDPMTSDIIALVVETRCSYFAPIAFPDMLEIGVATEHIGRSSVRYRLGVFRAGGEVVVAQATFTHVYVERATQSPAPIPEAARRLMMAMAAG